jgi:hypothetical protein
MMMIDKRIGISMTMMATMTMVVRMSTMPPTVMTRMIVVVMGVVVVIVMAMATSTRTWKLMVKFLTHGLEITRCCHNRRLCWCRR